MLRNPAIKFANLAGHDAVTITAPARCSTRHHLG